VLATRPAAAFQGEAIRGAKSAYPFNR
jgi:hypothetical protein